MNFEPPEEMSPEEILLELAEILARAYLRIRPREPSLPAELGPGAAPDFLEKSLPIS
jgi:hypothetical protein